MPRFIVTGCYTAGAMKGMMAKPSDRGAAAAKIAEAAGGKMEHYFVTTGPKDFMMVVSIEDVKSLAAGLMVAGATGAISNVETIRAFSSEEFLGVQKKASSIASAYMAPA
jgi:uncharacterized protein with GYD domain